MDYFMKTITLYSYLYICMAHTSNATKFTITHVKRKTNRQNRLLLHNIWTKYNTNMTYYVKITAWTAVATVHYSLYVISAWWCIWLQLSYWGSSIKKKPVRINTAFQALCKAITMAGMQCTIWDRWINFPHLIGIPKKLAIPLILINYYWYHGCSSCNWNCKVYWEHIAKRTFIDFML